MELPGLQAQQKLFQRMAVGERLARVLAHDFNNVFQPLFVHLQFAGDASAPGSPAIAAWLPRQREHFGTTAGGPVSVGIQPPATRDPRDRIRSHRARGRFALSGARRLLSRADLLNTIELMTGRP